MSRIFEIVSKFCHKRLLQDENVLKYLKNRKLTGETIEKFEIGLFPQDLRELYSIVSPEDLKKADIIYHASSSKFKTQDLIFPIKNVYGEYIAIAGRTRLSEKQRRRTPKYINTIYAKSHNLFGLDLAKREILKERKVYVVEGYFDVITPYQNNIKNIVAVCGKYLSNRQIALLARYTNKIVLIFDNEEEAQQRANKIAEKKQYDGIEIIAKNPFKNTEVKDIDEYLTKHTTKELLSLLEEGDYANIEVLW